MALPNDKDDSVFKIKMKVTFGVSKRVEALVITPFLPV